MVNQEFEESSLWEIGKPQKFQHTVMMLRMKRPCLKRWQHPVLNSPAPDSTQGLCKYLWKEGKKGYRRLPNATSAGWKEEYEFMSLSARDMAVDMRPPDTKCKH